MGLAEGDEDDRRRNNTGSLDWAEQGFIPFLLTRGKSEVGIAYWWLKFYDGRRRISSLLASGKGY